MTGPRDDLFAPAGPRAGLEVVGVLEATRGPLLRVRLPGAVLDQRVEIGSGALEGRIVGLEGGAAWVLPLGELGGLPARAPVRARGTQLTLPAAEACLGRLLDGLGRPLDDGPRPPACHRPAPSRVADRRPVDLSWSTGLRVLDGLLPIGFGQRVGLFSGPGAGKTSLLARLAQGPGHDVVVAALVGERSREVGAFLQALGPRRTSSIVIVATADDPAMLRLEAAWTATYLAALLRGRGRRVLLLVDSLTRFARATRELGAALGEPPCVRGYPARTFAELARLVEWGGATADGAVTAIHTVLEEDEDDPIADEIRSLLDGHLHLDPARAQRGCHPAIDVLRSVSRCAPELVTTEQAGQIARIRSWLGLLAQDEVRLGLIPPGQDPEVDRARARASGLEAFVRQGPGAVAPAETLSALRRLSEG